MALDAGLRAHLAGGVTTTCRCWRLERRDGRVFGFTSHDADLSFGGTVFRASEGLSTATLEQTTGLAVDNSEAAGVLSDAAITEADIAAGLYDRAAVVCWLVNWANPAERSVVFRGELGEIRRGGGAFRAELRGLTEMLNAPQGRVYQAPCPAVLGDAACGVNLEAPGLSATVAVLSAGEGVRPVFDAPELAAFAPRWFEAGRLRVLDGAARGEVAVIKNDRAGDGRRVIELWETLRRPLAVGDRVRLQAGCDKRAATCRAKFDNFVNFRGFPHIPGEDWLMATPRQDGTNDGGSRGA